jgi:hypothetical protein
MERKRGSRCFEPERTVARIKSGADTGAVQTPARRPKRRGIREAFEVRALQRRFRTQTQLPPDSAAQTSSLPYRRFHSADLPSTPSPGFARRLQALRYSRLEVFATTTFSDCQRKSET